MRNEEQEYWLGLFWVTLGFAMGFWCASSLI